MAEFEDAWRKTAAIEGGYSHDPDDRGGETFCGISRRRHPDWAGWAGVDAMRGRRDFPDCLYRDPALDVLVRVFYRERFWDAMDCDYLPQPLAEELFDTAVNQGVTTAVRYLQQALNALNRNQALYPDLRDDGVMGPKTRAALEAYLRHDALYLLLKVMNVLQGAQYVRLMRDDPTQEKFARGWLRRVAL